MALEIVPDKFRVSAGRAEDLALAEVSTDVLPEFHHSDGTVTPRYAKIVWVANTPPPPPPCDVTSVNGQTGTVVLTAADVGAYTFDEVDRLIEASRCEWNDDYLNP